MQNLDIQVKKEQDGLYVCASLALIEPLTQQELEAIQNFLSRQYEGGIFDTSRIRTYSVEEGEVVFDFSVDTKEKFSQKEVQCETQKKYEITSIAHPQFPWLHRIRALVDVNEAVLRKTGGLLERKGYEVRVFDLINPETSFCYNPFAYVRDDKDVLKLINNLIRNTTPKGAQSSDPFWEKSETALLQALMLYLLHEAPPEEQNFSMIMEMLGSAQVKEDDEEYQSPLDILFERLEMRNPESIAVKQYAIYKQAAGDICSK